MRLIDKTYGHGRHIGDVVTVPYHGLVRLTKIEYKAAGEHSNYSRTDLPCAVISYSDINGAELVSNYAYNGREFDCEFAEKFSFVLEE